MPTASLGPPSFRAPTPGALSAGTRRAIVALALALGPATGPARAEPVTAAGEAPVEPRLAAVDGERAGGSPATPGGPLGTVERLRITILGGNPIFALDWLAPGLELEGGRPAARPRLPLP